MRSSIKVKKLIELILITVLLLLTSNVYAATNSFKATLNVNNSSVKIGDTVTITIQLSDIAIESGEKGIGAYTANLEFDSSVFEYVKTNGTNNWEAPVYQAKKIVGNTADGKVVNTNQSIGTITFKVKEDATLGETTIKLTNFSGSTAESDVTTEDTSIKITILDKENGGSQSGNGGSSQNGSDNKSGSTSSSSSNKKPTVLPATGTSYITIYTLIGAFALVAIIFGIKIKLLNKKK